MLYYNYRVFQDPLVFPYQVNYRQYVAMGQFIWQSNPPIPAYRHKVMEDFYVSRQRAGAMQARTLSGFVAQTFRSYAGITDLLFRHRAADSAVLAALAIRDRRIRFLLWAGVVFAVGMALNPWFSPTTGRRRRPSSTRCSSSRCATCTSFASPRRPS